MDSLKAKANFSRICQLLVGKGGDALRAAFHAKHPTATLAAVLSANKPVLKKIRYSVITSSQWNLLYPTSGVADSKKFDIFLLTILLGNICGLSSPKAVLNVTPPDGDTSISADILRIKIFRNQVYGHITNPQLDDATFDTLWQEISIPLVKLGVPQQDIDEARVAPLSSEEEFYIEKLKEWKELEDNFLSKLNDVERRVNNVKDETGEKNSQTYEFAQSNLPEKIQGLCNKFQHGTRQWFFDQLSRWFDDKQQSRVMILTAGPGVGKSVLAAKVCEMYEKREKLAACHFCDFKNPDYSNPRRIVRSLFSQMCHNIKGFRDKLPEILQCEHSCPDSLSDAFRVLLNDPLHALDRPEPVLIVIDALDESKTDIKNAFLELISEEFPELPPWVKILITSRPELQVRNYLQHFNPVEIRPDDHPHNHRNDIQHYITHFLPDVAEDTLSSFILKCDGSFLYANYLVNELKEMDSGSPKLDCHTCSKNEESFPPSASVVTSRKNFKGKVINRHIEHSGKEENMLGEMESKEKALPSSKSFDSLESSAISRLRERENEIRSLRKQNELLQIKHEEILAELGEITIKNTAKENEEKRSKLFEQIFGSHINVAKDSSASVRAMGDDKKSSQNIDENSEAPLLSSSIVCETAACEQPVLGATALTKRSNHQAEISEIAKNDIAGSGAEVGDQNSAELTTVKSPNECQSTTHGTRSMSTKVLKETTNSKRKHLAQSGNALPTSEVTSCQGCEREDLSLSVQQNSSEEGYISLSNIPPFSVATTLYNNYKLLLMFIAQKLLSSDVNKLRNWADQKFSITNPENATDILFQLDEKGLINASDLIQIRDFFQSITRIDLVYVIDAFLLGDYSLLRQNPVPKRKGENRPQNRNTTTKYPYISNSGNTSRYSLIGTTSGSPGSSSVFQQSQQPSIQNFASTSPTHLPKSSNKNHLPAFEQQSNDPVLSRLSPTKMAQVAIADSPVADDRRTVADNASTRAHQAVTNSARNVLATGSTGQRPDTERSNAVSFQASDVSRNRDLNPESNWLCSHYKRLCYVKFECCDKFWPCHRCHNNQSSCGRKKLKSRDTVMVKCVHCNKVQQFGQYCCDCGAKFANYFCGLCKHLTGKDDHPYHCNKCGICRIHGDRSFHCDICGVCLDVQLRGNHKCREGSAHDECCICLEDAFTGCQILPCSHKVHKECATQMIRSGITRCPICRESFAHKLERRPSPNLRKPPGK